MLWTFLIAFGFLAYTVGPAWALGIIVLLLIIAAVEGMNRASSVETPAQVPLQPTCDLGLVERLVYQHGRELLMKRDRLIVPGDYGTTDRSKWNREIDRFFTMAVLPTLPSAAPYQEHFPKLLDSWLSLYEIQNPDAKTDGFSPTMMPVDYEHWCASLLNSMGWDAKPTVATGDQGADIVAQKNNVRIVVQCKLYGTPVGNAAVQEVFAAKSHYRADHAVVMTNSHYTTSAKSLAKSTGVTLIHHTQVDRLDQLLITNTA